MDKLRGKVVIITGCSGGLGKQIALRFASEGAKLSICARNEEKLQITATACQELGAEVFAKRVDLTVYDQMIDYVEDTVKRYGTIDILVNNAVSISPPHPFLEHTLEELETTIHSGYYATWHMMRLCFPYLKDKASSIINFGSSGGDLGMEGYAAYASTKEAIRALSRVAAREWGKYGIRVNTCSPGAVTDNVIAGVEHLSVQMKEYVMTGMKSNPMGRIGDPYEDITPVILFLASDESRWVTGQDLHAEGGANIHS